MKKIDDYCSYGCYFSTSELWNKIKNVAQKAGIKVVYAVLLLYYVATDENVSLSDKAKIYGALGYFILPIDLIPDIVPGGYVDDMSALLWALRAVWDNITPEIERKAKTKLREWFGTIQKNDLELF
ncbi:DUF1232 domain-containing protein [uncultured Bacteroides sp.]|uniref:YkvA family protein n=1 Tax=uncultured Bacteroides sp. TaxID=162156 RepID=UPI00260BCCE1|nr:DUF1232 domain-containing protein [uncultured Bacteroides sp.]